MKYLRTIFITSLLAISSINANASIINLADFNGSESLIDFNNEAPRTIVGSLTSQGVTFVAQSGEFLIQGAGGSLLGTSGAALNTRNTSGNADLTMFFATGVSRFGMNFGTCVDCSTLSAVVTAYDANGIAVESASFPSFFNAFVGFDFASSVSKIVIDRTDSSPFFTFIDNVRFASNNVPEPGSLALICIAALAFAASLRRRNS